MTVGYRSGSGNADSTAGTTITCPVPAGITADDVLVAITAQDADGAIANLTAGTSGFAQLGTDGVEVGISPAARCWWKVATGTESGDFTFGVDANCTSAAVMACLTGANEITPLDVTTSWSSGTGSTETAPGLTVGAGTMLISGFLEQGGPGHAHSTPGGMTEVSDQPTSWVALGMDVEARASAGATGTRASTLSLTGVVPTVRSSSVAGETGAVQSNVVPAKPAGLAVGDYLLALHVGDADGAVGSLTAPSGFTALSSQTEGQSNNTPCAKIWGKVATSTDVAASGFTFVDASSSSSVVILMAIQAGTYDSGTPTTISTWTVQPRTATVPQTAPSATGVTNGLLLAVYGTDTNGYATTYPSSGPAGMTLVDQLKVAGASYALGGVYSQNISAGSTGTRVVTPTGSPTQNGWIATSVIVNPPTATLDGNWRTVSLSIAAGGPMTYDKTGGAIAPLAGTVSRTTSTLTKRGLAAAGSVGIGHETVTHPPGIAAVGSLTGVEALGQVTFTVSTTTIGNAIIVGVRTTSASLTVSSMSGGGCTWTLAGNYHSIARGRGYEAWIGQVTSVVSGSTVTVTWSGDASAKTQSYTPQEFTNGAPSNWALDGTATAGFETSSTTTTLLWPSLTAAAAGELYIGKGSVTTGTPTTTGTPAGFTFIGTAECWCWGKTTGSGAIAPTQTTGTAAQFGAVGVLIVATPAATTTLKTGGAITRQTGIGAHAGSRWTKTGGAITAGAGIGARAGTRQKSGGATTPGAGIGARAGTRQKSGGGATGRVGSGPKVFSSGPKTGGATAPLTAVGGKSSILTGRTGGAITGAVASGPARMTSDWSYATTATTLAGTAWATPTGAIGPTTGDFSIWTGPGSQSGVGGTLELAGFPLNIPTLATPESVTIRVRHAESPIEQVASVAARIYIAGAPLGGSQQLTKAAYPHEDLLTVSGLSYSDLVNLRVRIIVTRI